MIRTLKGLQRAGAPISRKFSTSRPACQKVLCLLYPGGAAGKQNPKILGCVENALGLRGFLQQRGKELIVSSDQKEIEKHLPDAEIVISQPFWPFYLTKERMEKSPKLKMSITAGVGSDHVDLQAAVERKLTVAEVTGSNVVSVAEHVVMQILALVRNFIPGYQQVVNGEWNIAAVADRAYDLEGKNVGTVAAGRIGHRVLKRLKPFDCKLHYFDTKRLSPAEEKELGVKYHDSVESLVKACDVVTINCPLHKQTEHLFNAKMLSLMKPGAYIVNTARGKIMDRDALVEAVKSGRIAGYAGDVWFPQPAPRDHPWRSMPRHAMTPHYSGTTLDAQARYAAGVKEILSNYYDGKKQPLEYLIVDNGKLASAAYTVGNTTSGSL